MSIDQASGPPTGFDSRSVSIGTIAILTVAAIGSLVLWGAWDALPEQVATHWNAAGEADDYTDRSARLAILLIGLPTLISVGLAVLLGFVPRSAPGTRAISAIPVGLAAGVLTLTVGSAVQQRDGGDASIGVLMVSMLAVAVVATVATVPLLPRAAVPPSAGPPPPDAPRLETSGRVWWTGTARLPPLAVVGLVVLLLAPAAVVLLTTPIGWVIALILLVPVLVVVANSRFRVTIGGDRIVVSGALFGWPRLTLPLDTIAAARTGNVSIWQYGGFGLRYGPSGTGVITRGGEALLVRRSDDTVIAITCDDPATAAATINSIRVDSMRERTT